MSKIDRARGTHHAFDKEHLVMFFDLMEFMEVDNYEFDVIDDDIYISAVDSDLFAWGYSESIPLAPADIMDLQNAYNDCEAIIDGIGYVYAPNLWCCRKVGSRPQGSIRSIRSSSRTAGRVGQRHRPSRPTGSRRGGPSPAGSLQARPKLTQG